MLGRIVNVIKESELDRLSTSWAMARASRLLCRRGTAAPELHVACARCKGNVAILFTRYHGPCPFLVRPRLIVRRGHVGGHVFDLYGQLGCI